MERELRLAIKRERLKELPLYPEQRSCKRATTEQILRLFSFIQRQTLIRNGRLAQVFPAELTDLQRQVLACWVHQRTPSAADQVPEIRVKSRTIELMYAIP